jgi:hypothetical protein
MIKKQICSCGAGRDAEMKFEDAEGGMYFACGDKVCQSQFRKEIEDLKFQQTHQGRKRSSYDSSMDAIMYCLFIGAILAIGHLILWLIK